MIIKLPPYYCKSTNGELKLEGDCVYKILGSRYVAQVDEDSEHLEVEVEDVTTSEAGQVLIDSKKLGKARAKYVFNQLGEIQNYGVIVELVNGRMIAQPDGEDLSGLFNVDNLDVESGRFIWLKPANTWEYPKTHL